MTASSRVSAGALLLLALLQGSGVHPYAAPQDPVTSPQAPFRTGVNFVRVDVLVTDGRDGPVVDLTKDDFEVLEDGKLQMIEQFRLVQVDGQPDPRNPLPETIRSRDDEAMIASRDDVRVFAIFLDDYHIRPTTWRSVRDELIRFVRAHFRPNDLVAVMDPSTPVRALTFTRDHESIVSAMREFEGRRCEPEVHGPTCQGAYMPPRNVFEKEYAYMGRGVVERVRREVTISALQGLAVRLGSLREGRKAVIYVSEGFGASLSMTLMLRDVYRDANRHNTSFYTVDPRRLEPGRVPRSNQETLRLLAEETGGRAILNTNAVSDALAGVIRDASVYYLLGYSSTSSQNDGKFHEVKVRVKRRGVTVNARKGYWAMTAADAARAVVSTGIVAAPPALRALSALAAADANKFIYRWVGTERGADGRTRVTVAWEPKADQNRPARLRPGRVGLMVTGEDGKELFRGGGPAADVHVQVFETTPGQHNLRLTVEAAADGETIDRDLLTVDVPDLTASGAMSTPRVFRARTVNEFRAAVAGGAALTARREFLRSDRLLIRLDAYAADGMPAEVTAALVNASGRRIAEVKVAPAAMGGTHQMDVSLGPLSHGEYVIEIGSGDMVEFVPFRIIG
jgi:VWFA-related protein